MNVLAIRSDIDYLIGYLSGLAEAPPGARPVGPQDLMFAVERLERIKLRLDEAA